MSSEQGPISDQALSVLSTFLDGFNEGARSRGRTYFKAGRVSGLVQDGQRVRAEVRGTEDYNVVLAWAHKGWVSQCSCPLEYDCKHAYATGLAWLRKYDRAPKTAAEKIIPMPLPLRPGEEELVAEFTAATGQPPDRAQLAFLRNLQAVHRSLNHRGYSWFDYTALAALAPTKNRYQLQQFYQNPFEDWWQRAPATPLLLWPFVALLFTEHGIALPAFTAPFDHLATARQSRESVQREAELRLWRERFNQLEQLTATPPAPANQTAVRLRLGAKKLAWEISPAGPDGPFSALPANDLRNLLQDPVYCAQVMDEASNVLLTFLRANLHQSGRATLGLNDTDDRTLLGHLLTHPLARTRVVGNAGEPIIEDDRTLTWKIDDHPTDAARVVVRLTFSDGTSPPAPLHHLPGLPARYLSGSRLFRGLPPLTDLPKKNARDFATELPRKVLELPEAGRFAARTGIKLPGDTAGRYRSETLRARFRATLTRHPNLRGYEALRIEFEAIAPGGEIRARYLQSTWATRGPGVQPAPDAAFVLHEFSALVPAAVHLGLLPGMTWINWPEHAAGYFRESLSPSFCEDFSEWLASMPAGVLVELSPELAAFAAPPTAGHFSLEATESGIDWFDVQVKLRVEDTTLTDAEIALLRRANGRFIRLAGKGWRRLQVDLTEADRARLDRLGLDPVACEDREPPRFHALQLADESLGDALPEKLWKQIRDRAASIRQIAVPPLPAGLRAELRPYQLEGFHYLAHLTENRFGGVLADDMGLGKTLQALAWLLWLTERPKEEVSKKRKTAATARPFRALIVCPKSVVFNWETETSRFAPTLTTARLTPRTAAPLPANAQLVIVNYTQLRLNAEILTNETWDAVILDEGQNIKNPASATAQAARALRAPHRLVLTGTPIENRLLDLWSLFAFAQPGLLGGQTQFKRLYNDKTDPGARGRLANRVRHFMLRRTKGQVARDLPPRTEEDIIVELDGPQRALYDAELKRTRALLLKVETSRDFDAARFNILQSLLRLRQICCDPRLLGADLASEKPARRKPSTRDAGLALATADIKTVASAKLEALLDTLEPLAAEGHRVLVFSQFVTMLELIRAELSARDIKYLLLTGQTENRQELVQQFQAPDGPPVFLLSLKAAGSGLNLTAASYVVLYDPWWNPAVEAQAIDRTHRIGQTAHVLAYRLLARNTVEEKIRALQKEKAAMAAAVVQEESLAKVLDLESLRQILS